MRYQLKFYANHALYKNKQFTFGVSELNNIPRLLAYFADNGNVFGGVFVSDHEEKRNVQLSKTHVKLCVVMGQSAKENKESAKLVSEFDFSFLFESEFAQSINTLNTKFNVGRTSSC